MDRYHTAESWTGVPGAIAPADGNLATGVAPASLPAGAAYPSDENRRGAEASAVGAQHAAPLLAETENLGANNERLDAVKPELVNALRELVRQYRQEGVVARRHEIRRIRQARLFWQGLQYAWWNPNDMNWHLPYENRSSDDRELEEMPRYQFVTNFYQGFGLSFIAVLSQDVPSGVWEWRADGLYFLGATQDTQMRLRYLKAYPDFTDATSPVLVRNAQEAIAYATTALAGWARGSPLAEKWDDAAADAIEDLVSAAVRREQQSARRRRPFSARTGYTPF